MKAKVGILDYGMGNILSIINALNYLNIKSEKITDYKKIDNFDFIILPGVGAFGEAMKNLKKKNFIEPLSNYVNNKNRYLVGICLGLQLIGKSSSEITYNKGLAFADFETKKFTHKKNFPIPHVGFNKVIFERKNDLLKGIDDESYFYFTHSYRVKYKKNKFFLGSTNYIENFLSLYVKENIIAMQFHPEKSQINGLNLLKNIFKL